MLMIFGSVENPDMPADSEVSPTTIGDEVRADEVAAAEFEAETDEEQLDVDEEAKYKGLTAVKEAMVHSAVQILLADTFMPGTSGSSVAITPGTDSQDQSVTPDTDAPTDGATI
uniref:Polyprotein protein n=1 Tax=Solanum tuberosum TaxID=4113 RepID=M1DLD1_SOLTU